MRRKLSVIPIAFALLLAGCQHRVNLGSTPEQKIAKAANLLAISTNTAIDVTVQLNAAGLLTKEQTAEVLIYERKVLVATGGISAILSTPTDWPTKVFQIKALIDQIVPPTTYLKYAGMNDVQYQALVTSVQGVVSGVQLLMLEVQ